MIRSAVNARTVATGLKVLYVFLFIFGPKKRFTCTGWMEAIFLVIHRPYASHYALYPKAEHR